MQTSDSERKLAELDRDLIVDRLTRFIVASSGSRATGLDSCLSPDLLFELIGPTNAHPCFGLRRGPDGWRQYVATLREDCEFEDLRLGDPIVFGSQAALRYEFSARHRATGALEQVRACALLKFQDGLIAECSLFLDTDSLLRALSG